MLKVDTMKPFYDIEKLANKKMKRMVENIKDTRLALKLTQKDLSDISGVSITFIRVMEAGKSIPTILSYNKIVQSLKIYSRMIQK